jgi:hypothetical protein
MNEKPNHGTAKQEIRRKFFPRGIYNWAVRTKTIFGVLVAGLAVLICSALADDQPVLTIAPTGTNQFLISITNASGSATYELYRTPVLNDAAYPWTLSVTGAVGQSNFIVTKGSEPTGFWKASEGSDWDFDGIPNWMDADPNNGSVGVLSVTIVSPANGSNVD